MTARTMYYVRMRSEEGNRYGYVVRLASGSWDISSRSFATLFDSRADAERFISEQTPSRQSKLSIVSARISNPIRRDPIVYEHGDYYVTRNSKGHFEVWKMGATAATHVSYIGYEGQKGLDRAKAEVERREREHNPIHRVPTHARIWELTKKWVGIRPSTDVYPSSPLVKQTREAILREKRAAEKRLIKVTPGLLTEMRAELSEVSRYMHSARESNPARKATYNEAMAAGQDAGNRNAKKHGRKTWNKDDYNVAAATVEKLLGRESNPVPLRARNSNPLFGPQWASYHHGTNTCEGNERMCKKLAPDAHYVRNPLSRGESWFVVLMKRPDGEKLYLTASGKGEYWMQNAKLFKSEADARKAVEKILRKHPGSRESGFEIKRIV